jgi:hypothetical protein
MALLVFILGVVLFGMGLKDERRRWGLLAGLVAIGIAGVMAGDRHSVSSSYREDAYRDWLAGRH